MGWPDTEEDLVAAQEALAVLRPAQWSPSTEPVVAGCFACLPRGGVGAGAAGDPVWAAAAAYRGRRRLGLAAVTGVAAGPYRAGLLALRVGRVLEAAAARLPVAAEVVLLDATGRDHPRRAGLAVHLGAVLGVPTVGVTHRPLLATGRWPSEEPGAVSPLWLDGEVVGYWLRTRRGRRPVAVHAGWRTGPDTAVALVRAQARRHRTPTPLREARRLARTLRASGPPGRPGETTR